MSNSKISNVYKELISLTGDAPQIDEPQCIIWKADHPNCYECPSELPCGKLVHLMLVAVSVNQYSPTSYEDFQQQHNRIEELQDRILKAQTDEELKAIPLR